MPRGTVSWFSDEKGFGFVRTPEGRDILVNYTDITPNGGGELGFRSLEIGSVVEYEVTKNAHGRPLACGVRALNGGDDVKGK